MSTTERVQQATDARERYFDAFRNANAPECSQWRRRSVGYLEDDHDGTKILGVFLASGALGGAVTGGCAGAAVGFAFGGPPGAVGGLAIGVPVGAIVGTIIAGGVSAVYLRPRFEEWKKSEKGAKYYQTIEGLLKEEKVLQHMICPLKLLPVVHGVRTPDGQLWERDALYEAIDKDGLNPITRERLTRSQVTPDPTASIEANKKLVNFFKELKSEKISPEANEGLECLIADCRHAFIEIYNKNMSILQKELAEKKITYEVFVAKSKDIQEKYLTLT